jgi:hypothetical protein
MVPSCMLVLVSFSKPASDASEGTSTFHRHPLDMGVINGSVMSWILARKGFVLMEFSRRTTLRDDTIIRV